MLLFLDNYSILNKMIGSNKEIKYEIDFLTVEETNQEIKKLLEKSGGMITSEKESLKIQLSYPIKKQKYAFWNSVAFAIDSNNLTRIINNLKFQSNILRFMIKRFPAKEGKKLKFSPGEKIIRKSPQIRKQVSLKKVEVLTNEDLEKKIQEIDSVSPTIS